MYVVKGHKIFTKLFDQRIGGWLYSYTYQYMIIPYYKYLFGKYIMIDIGHSNYQAI